MAALLAGCAPTAAPPPAPAPAHPDSVHLLDGCEVRSPDGELLKVLAGRLCVFLDGGDVVTAVGAELLRYAPTGQIRWRLPVVAHHQLELTPSGTILAVTADKAGHVDEATGRRVEYHSFHEISTDGEILFAWSTWDHREALRRLHPAHPMLEDRPPAIVQRYAAVSPRPSLLFREVERMTGAMSPARAAAWDRATTAHFKPDTEPDAQALPGAVVPILGYYHLNSVQALPANVLAEGHPEFAPGNYLLSLCNFSMLVVVERGTGEVIWSRTLPFGQAGQHAARLASDGRVTLFVNNEWCGDELCSSLVELDPITGEQLWSWRPERPSDFHSLITGWVERQPSGNYLVSWSRGAGSFEAFELTREGEIVWRWSRPSGLEDGELYKFFFRISRVPWSRVETAMELF